ncbi:unnamed protein product [Adineta steineri]|uniref:Purple acid phosphatase n=1 Tax=Adineta steineri TaxID=433720 RepID=A0A815Q823_9BILA|nr:unnamed protein product [Adineta steineri]CAF3774292.1 unnamed protein product [Adineta steineri]
MSLIKSLDSTICLAKLVPDQIRLAFAGNQGVSVGWQSFGCPLTTSNPNPTPTVIYGLSKTNLNLTSINGNSSVYDTNNILKTSWFYSVELTNLQPSTVYYYQIKQSNYVSASNIFSFTSAPVYGSRSRAINIITYGDFGVDGIVEDILNGKCLFERALGALQKMLPVTDFFLHHGDICYADDSPEDLFLTYEGAFNYCQSMMTNITSTRFYMTAVGNHEVNCTEIPVLNQLCSSSKKNQVPYSHRFNMPSKQSGGYLNSWYSFDYGFVHVISISCESDFPLAPSGNLLDTTTQVSWLKNDLSKINRTITPWVIVQCHRAWKGSISKADIKEDGIINCPSCKAAFESLLIQYNVDLYLAGHVHWYERICLNGVVNTTQYVNPIGPVYLINGAIGSPEGNDVLSQRSNDSCFLTTDPGFGFLTITDPSHATFTYYRVSDMAILDQITIVKNR